MNGSGTPLRIEDMTAKGVTVHVCAGPPLCDGKGGHCPYCYVVPAGDPRTTEEVLADMRKRNRLQ